MLVRGDARWLPLLDASVDCVVTSPPYFGLRDYGSPHQIGLETTPDTYVTALVDVFREVRRVLTATGTVWLNLGDSYCASAPGLCADPMKTSGLNGIGAASYRADRTTLRAANRSKSFDGLKPKDLVGIPWMVAFALRADGWYLRSDIIWAKPSCMPESVTDRPTRAHEYLFLLAKGPQYFYDADAIKEPLAESTLSDQRLGDDVLSMEKRERNRGGRTDGLTAAPGATLGNASGRNKRSVWTVNPEPYSGAHFATMPEKLIEPCICAGTSEGGYCLQCSAPGRRIVERETYRDTAAVRAMPKTPLPVVRAGWRDPATQPHVTTLGWAPSCACGVEARPGRVLDPFVGSGTVVAVAQRLGRRGVGIDLAYQGLAKARTAQLGLSFV